VSRKISHRKISHNGRLGLSGCAGDCDGCEGSEVALYPMAIRSDDDKRRTCPYLQASQVSISNWNKQLPPMSIPAIFETQIVADPNWRIPKPNKILSIDIKVGKKRYR